MLLTAAAGAGIGQAAARRFAAGGATVVVTDIHARRTQEVTAAIAADYPQAKVIGHPMDAGDRAAIDRVVDTITAEHGGVDVLVNNAAVNVIASHFDYDPEVWDWVVNVNLSGPWYLCRRILPIMRDRKRGGVIVNVSSYAPDVGGQGLESPYAITKGGLNVLTRSVAHEGGPFGIRAVTVSMGVVRGTKFIDDHPEILASPDAPACCPGCRAPPISQKLSPSWPATAPAASPVSRSTSLPAVTCASDMTHSSTLQITRVSGPFGAAVANFDAAAPIDNATVRFLVDALFEHHILLLGDQRLSEADYARFGRLWGDPLLFFVPQHRHGTFPEIIKIRNSPATPPESRDGAMHWHSDSTYEAVPASVTMLYGIEAPEAGNDTMFADLAAAYDALPPTTKDMLEPLQVLHDPRGGKVNLPDEVRGRGATQPLPVVTHPLVMRHPVTGRRALFGISGTASGIVGVDEAEAIDLLLGLKRHALQPQFRQRARVEAGTILIWDNFAVMHCATRTEYSDDDGKRRLLYRISTKGRPPVYR